MNNRKHSLDLKKKKQSCVASENHLISAGNSLSWKVHSKENSGHA